MTDMLICWHLNHLHKYYIGCYHVNLFSIHFRPTENYYGSGCITAQVMQENVLYLLFRIPNHKEVIELREKGLGRQGEEKL